MLLGALARWHRVMRQAAFAQAQRQAATPRDRHAVGQCLRNVGEQGRHLRRRAQVLLARVFAPAGRVGQLRAVMDADARLMGLEIRLGQKAHVIGGHHRHAAVGGQFQCGRHIRGLACPAHALQLQVVAIAEQAAPGLQLPPRLGRPPHQQAAPHVAIHRPRQGDEALHGAGIQPAALHQRRIAPLPLQITAAHQAREVEVAHLALAQQREPRGRITLLRLGQPQVDADQGLHALGDRRPEEFHHREEVRLIGQGNGRHLFGHDSVHQFWHAHDTVDEGELGMKS